MKFETKLVNVMREKAEKVFEAFKEESRSVVDYTINTLYQVAGRHPESEKMVFRFSRVTDSVRIYTKVDGVVITDAFLAVDLNDYLHEVESYTRNILIPELCEKCVTGMKIGLSDTVMLRDKNSSQRIDFYSFLFDLSESVAHWCNSRFKTQGTYELRYTAEIKKNGAVSKDTLIFKLGVIHDAFALSLISEKYNVSFDTSHIATGSSLVDKIRVSLDMWVARIYGEKAEEFTLAGRTVQMKYIDDSVSCVVLDETNDTLEG